MNADVPLSEMSVRDLVAELTVIQERINRDAAAGGYQPLPGQTQRRAALLRRENQVIHELRQRPEYGQHGHPGEGHGGGHEPDLRS